VSTDADDVRHRLVLALDVDDFTDAVQLADRLAPWFSIVKVGHELYAAAGPATFEACHELGFRVFADLKLYDIPSTVARAARVHGGHGVDFLNFHAAGGVEMVAAGVNALREGASDRGYDVPVALGVTVLTSDLDTGAFDARLEVAESAGCDGVVCSAHELDRVQRTSRPMKTMVPGVRLTGGEPHDQARVATPLEAMCAGADWLVIGRAVTAAESPEAAATMITESIVAAPEAPRP
jgi:orotidine-5'-phosphate decarboxylase